MPSNFSFRYDPEQALSRPHQDDLSAMPSCSPSGVSAAPDPAVA